MDKFIKKIKNYKYKQNFLILLSFLTEYISILMLLFLITFALTYIKSDIIFYIVQLIKLGVIVISIYFGIKIYKSFLSDKDIARILDLKNSDSSEILLNALELKNDKFANREILKKIFEKADKKIEHTNLNPDFSVIKNKIIPFLLILTTFVFVYISANINFMDTIVFLSRIKPPEKEHKHFVEVLPGNKKILINSNLIIQVVQPEENVEHILYYKIDKIWRKTVLDNYSKTFNNLDFSFDYYIKTPYAVSDTFHISVFELPVIKKMKITYFYPQYTRLKTYEDTTGTGNITALKNTKIKIYIKANNPIKSAEMFFSYKKHLTMQRIDKYSFLADFKIIKNGYYYIDLTDVLNNKAEKIEYTITVLKDEYPEIEFLYPAKDTMLTKDMKTPLKIIASDDFGLKNPILHYQINERSVKNIPIKDFMENKIVSINYIFDLNSEELYPGDNIIYWCEISDNCPEKHTSYTSKYLLKFPSIQEIYKSIEKEEKEKNEKLNDIYNKTRKLQKQFDVERRNVLKKNKMSWEQKEKLKEILKKQKDMSKNVEKVAKEYEKLIKTMEKNKTVTKETLEKLKKIQELMKDINNEKLKKAMEEMQKKLEKATFDDLKKAMEKMKFSMEEFNKKLEETIKLLKQIKKEQALEKSLELIKEMEKQQKNINQETQENAENNKKLAKKQEKIGEDLKNLKEQLEKTSKLMDSDQDKKLKDELKKLMKQMEKDSLSQNIEKSKKQLSKGDMKQAQMSQQKISKSLQSMKSKLQQMMSMMSNSAGMQIKNSIQNTILKFFYLSKEPFEIKKVIKNDPQPYMNNLIRNYQALNYALQKLYSTPMIMLVLGQKFLTDAANTITSYQKLFENVADRRYYNLKRNLSEVYEGYNKMIFDLLQSKKNMMNQKGGMQSSGMEAMMQALQQMGQQQMMMNMITMKMLNQMMQNGGKMGNELRRQARKLAEEEGRLAENIRRMLQTNSEAQKRSGILGNIAKELNEISQRFKENRIDNQLIDKQKRILSRLLEAQKSIHKRGFSKKRKSEISDKNFIGIKKNNRQKIDEIKLKSLLKESETDYPIEYRKLIDEYLKKLNEGI